jgi:glucose/arabinose dehydrogenase
LNAEYGRNLQAVAWIIDFMDKGAFRHFPSAFALALSAAPALPLVLTSLTAACAQSTGRTAAPFGVTRVAEFHYPWRIAFLPDGRMVITEKPGKLWLVTQQGAKSGIAGVPAVTYENQGGLLGVYLAPSFASDRGIYLTYAEPGGRGSGLALAHATLDPSGARLNELQVIWRQLPRGKGGQFGGAVAFSPDGKLLYLAVGDRQRMTPAQDPNQPEGKILRLTLDGRPAPGNPSAGKTGAATVPLIDPPRDTEAAKHAPVVERYTYKGPNLTPAETWATGFRTPYGLAFGPDGRLWELEHGPRGGDELNLIEPGKNYGWPLVSWGVNYDGVPIPEPPARPDLTAPVIQWTPVIGPGNLMFYTGKLFPDWRGSAIASGLVSEAIHRIVFDGKGSAREVEHFAMGFRVRDVAQAPDGAIWLIADDDPGGLYRLAPK